jgi:hypothetical protein
MKKDYQIVKNIQETSGFGLDNNNYLLIAEDLIWDSYIQVFIYYSSKTI